LEGFPSVSCKGCGHVFCFDHGDAHAGQSCPPPSPQLIDAQMKISSISKQCPQCKVCIERSGGCPHMTCAVCGCEWCWMTPSSKQSAHGLCSMRRSMRIWSHG
jgi:hypothetical protein